MKKKVKLFITFASLCLSIAMLTFGVYAATSVTYTISGKVSYTVSDVFATISTSVQPASNSKSGFASASAVPGSATWGTATVTESVDTYSGDVAKADTTFGSKTDVNLDFNTSTLWKIEITITSKQDVNLYVNSISGTETTTFTNALWVKDSKDGVSQTISTKNGTCVLTYYAALKSTLANASGNWSISFTLTSTAS